MKTIEIKLYTFDELSEDAKQTAIENIRNSEYEYSFGDEIIKSIEKGLEHYNCTLKDYSIDWNCINGSDYRIEFNGNYSEIEELSGVRLWKYINNNFMTYYCKYDKVFKKVLDGNCPFTGVCFDEDFLDNIREFMKKPNSQTFEELIKDSVYNCINSGCKDFEYQMSYEGITEMISINEYEFTEEGNIY